MKYSKVSGAVRWSGGTTILGVGQSADDDHPLVKERPDLWGAEAPGASLTAPPRVERATRAPGEVRKVAPGAAKKAAPKSADDR